LFELQKTLALIYGLGKLGPESLVGGIAVLRFAGSRIAVVVAVPGD
jgi:hypothetical protein